jgi:fructokinase
MKTLDLVAVGEVLVDLISEQPAPSLEQADRFRRFPGGQVANTAWNVSLLGGKAAVVGCVGGDGFGRFLRGELERIGVATRYLYEIDGTPTTLSVVVRHSGTPDFLIYRGADGLLSRDRIPIRAIGQARALHTSAFGLSREPARSAILYALRIAREAGCLVSIDPNYHPAIWDGTTPAIEVLRQACHYVDVVKPSLDDCRRIFGTQVDPEGCVSRFLDWGARVVVLTMGEEGALLALADGERSTIPAHEVDVADVTGAGDAFWAGLIVGLLDGLSPHQAAEVGRSVAERKLATVGPMREPMDRPRLYQTLWEKPPCTSLS